MRRAATKAFATTVTPAREMMKWALMTGTLMTGALMASLAIGASAARAQEAIPTAAGVPGDGAPPALESGPLRLSDRIDEGPDALRPVGPCGGPARKEDGKPDKSPHGEVWAGIGNHGYRDIGGVVCAPLGDNAAMSIAVDAGQLDGWGHRR